MRKVVPTKIFQGWLADVKDPVSRAIIAQHIVRLKNCLGDVKSVGEGVRELRIDVGPGWRVYFIEVESQIVILLLGGTKRSQQADIDKAKQMVKEFKVAAKSTVAAKPREK